MSKRILNPAHDWKKTICIDFDGVIAEYNGWKGPEFYGRPKKGAKEFLEKIQSKGFKIVIFTIRPRKTVCNWFKENKIITPDSITNVKIPAIVYIDDRALKFNGDFLTFMPELHKFNVYWEDHKPFQNILK